MRVAGRAVMLWVIVKPMIVIVRDDSQRYSQPLR